MFTLIMCDDNKDFLEQEHKIASDYLSSCNIEYRILQFSNGVELLKCELLGSSDLILLDYDMEKITGFEVAKIIREKYSKPSIAFVTVFYEFAREGYKFDAIRYLVKQESTFNQELIDCLEKAIQIKANRVNSVLTIDFCEETVSLLPEEIVYIQADRHYLNYCIVEGKTTKIYRKREKINDSLRRLADTNMFALMRTGLIVNFKYVRSIVIAKLKM